MKNSSVNKLERVFKRIKRKMGKYDYYETNLGIVIYKKQDEGELIEISDINYGTYKLFLSAERVSYTYMNEAFNGLVSVSANKKTLRVDYVYNNLMVSDIGYKLVMRDNKVLGYYEDDTILGNCTIREKEVLSGDVIVQMGNNCILSCCGTLNEIYNSFMEIIASNNKIKKRVLV